MPLAHAVAGAIADGSGDLNDFYETSDSAQRLVLDAEYRGLQLNEEILLGGLGSSFLEGSSSEVARSVFSTVTETLLPRIRDLDAAILRL